MHVLANKIAFMLPSVQDQSEIYSLHRRADNDMKHLPLADDDANIRALLRHVMTKEGYRVHEAQDGLAAVKLMQETPIDLAILDVMMPGMDGLELCDYIRQRLRYSNYVADGTRSAI